MEFAYDLLENKAQRRPRDHIVANSRTIIVPVVNVDGFHISRARAARRLPPLRLRDEAQELPISAFTTAASSAAPAPPTRPGASGAPTPTATTPASGAAAARAPTAERHLPRRRPRRHARGRQHQAAHLRAARSRPHQQPHLQQPRAAPAVAALHGLSPDEPQYKALGASMTETNDYTNQASFQLYDTSGSVEDWSYWQTGGLGFTFEIGPDELPPGLRGRRRRRVPGPGARGGRRPGRQPRGLLPDGRGDDGSGLHSTITGTAPAGRTLTVSKQFQAMTSPVLQPNGTVGAADPLRQRPVELAEEHGRQVLVGGQPVDPSRGRRPLRP